MNNWKKDIQKILSDSYPGTTIKWKKNDEFALVIPDKFAKKAKEIMKFLTKIWKMLDGDVKFYPEKAIKS